jgi:hypothetical protein
MRPLTRVVRLLVLAWLAIVVGGCAGAVGAGASTALDGIDLEQMTDQMARSIAADPQVQQAIAQRGTLRVVVLPAENHMRGEVLPTGAAYAFTARVRTQLGLAMPGQFEWILNREAFYSKRQELEGLDLGPAPDAVDPQFALVARFYSLTGETMAIRSSDYLCAFELSDLETRTVLWSDTFRTRKSVRRTSLD